MRKNHMDDGTRGSPTKRKPPYIPGISPGQILRLGRLFRLLRMLRLVRQMMLDSVPLNMDVGQKFTMGLLWEFHGREITMVIYSGFTNNYQILIL